MKLLVMMCVATFFIACGNEPKKSNPVDRNNANNAAQCGDGELQAGELCDRGIADGEGTCPTQCAAPACSTVVLQGTSDDCTAECVVEPIACQNADGCCPVGCDSTTDDDCTNLCGDGTVEEPETCDGDCPESCDDGDACTNDEKSGDAETCSVVCRARVLTACQNGDGCCPSGCTEAEDNDCETLQSCGDGTLDPGELCDGDCPSTCDDNEACSIDQLVGSDATCDARCIFTPIDACVNNDGCCPPGCANTIDNDCVCTPTTCNGEGYVCGTFDDGCMGTISCGVCAVGACNANGQCQADPSMGKTGDPCNVDEDCTAIDPNNPLSLPTCRTDYPGGYCSSICIAGFLECLPGSICNVQECVKSCNNNGDCRAGYSCQAITGGNACLPT